MVHGKKRIPYWIDRRLTGLAGPDYAATISFGLPIEPEDSQYGKYRVKPLSSLEIMNVIIHGSTVLQLMDGPILLRYDGTLSLRP